MIDSWYVVSRGEKMALRGTVPESYITEYTLVYEETEDVPVALWTAQGMKTLQL